MTQAARRMPDTESPATDASLAGRAREGDVHAFEELAKRHQDRLLCFLLQRTRHRADAEDALQNALLKAFRHIGQYDPRWAFPTWLFTIASRELTTIQRRQRPAMSLDGAIEPPAAPAGRDEPLLDTPGELWALARDILTEEQFTALWLCYAEEMDGAQAARVLRRSRVWVRVTVFRARRALRKALDQKAVPKSPAQQRKGDL